MTTTLIQPSQPAGSSACHYNPAAMALDTIKSTKNHKTFPFTTPTITTHNKTPTGALILEIIFSDDTSSPNTTQDKGECNEDDNDSDSDEEDDVDSTSNSDAHSNNNDSDSDGDDVDEQDQEHVEDGGGGGGQGDSDDDEEEGHGHEDDEEDFESAFDNDLIIDFGNDNEEDQLVVEFEETHSNKTSPRSSPPPKPVDLPPFWFSHEESGMFTYFPPSPSCVLLTSLLPLFRLFHVSILSLSLSLPRFPLVYPVSLFISSITFRVLIVLVDQLCIIFESYGVTLNLEEQRKACIRSPAVCPSPPTPLPNTSITSLTNHNKHQ